MDSFSYTDGIRAALASCLPSFTSSHSKSTTNASATTTDAGSSSTTNLEHLLRDPDSDALSLHSNLGAGAHRRARHRRRPKFSLTLFGYTLFGKPPIYLSDDDDDDDDGGDPLGIGGRARVLPTASSSTLDSDAALLDASTIERLTSPDHFAALAARRERLEAEEAARRKAERRARRQERKARARADALASLTGASPRSDVDTFEGFQGSGNDIIAQSFSSRHGGADFNGSHSGDADDADLDGELYTQKKKSPAALSASGSDSRSRTSASFSGGDSSHIQSFPIHTPHVAPYPHTEMHLPSVRNSHRASKRTSTVSSVTSQSTSTAPYTPVESIAEVPAVAASPVPQERYLRDGERADFPSVGLTGKQDRRPNRMDPKAFLA